MTEEEAYALDEELTRIIPNVDFSKPDIFINQRELLNSRGTDCCFNITGLKI